MNREFFETSSEQIDAFFGLRINHIESELLLSARALRPHGNMSNFGEVLHGGHQTWVGLDPQTLNTPYSELALICDLLQPKENEFIVDLGAGYGRLGLVLKILHPSVRFQGFELVEERVREGNRIFSDFDCSNSKLATQDLMDQNFLIPVADYYFLYDFGKVEHIRKVLNQLKCLADNHHFKVIARGKGSRSLIDYEHPWLSEINDVHREENFTIYTY